MRIMPFMKAQREASAAGSARRWKGKSRYASLICVGYRDCNCRNVSSTRPQYGHSKSENSTISNRRIGRPANARRVDGNHGARRSPRMRWPEVLRLFARPTSQLNSAGGLWSRSSRRSRNC